MPLVSFRSMLQAARQQGYAVGAFNPVDYLTMKAIIQAAEELDAPIIIQTSAKTVRFWGVDVIAGWMRELAGRSPIPVTLHLDHGKDLNMIRSCIESGWTAVMFDGSERPFEENLAITAEVINWAKPKDVAVEAELGAIGGVEEEINVDDEDVHLASPNQAVLFCRELDLGVFAPAIGTAHGIYKGAPKIAFDRLEEMHRSIPVPFALHGGTGLSDEIIQRCIRLGCAKINISTNLKYLFIDSFCDYHTQKPADYEPLRLIDVQFQAVKTLVSEKIRQFGSVGKASERVKGVLV